MREKRNYKIKQANIDKLNKYVEKLKEEGVIREDLPLGDTGRRKLQS